MAYSDVSAEDRDFASRFPSANNVKAENIRKRIEAAGANPETSPGKPTGAQPGPTGATVYQSKQPDAPSSFYDMQRDPAETKAAEKRAKDAGSTNYKDFMYMSSEKTDEYNRLTALVESQFGATAKQKSTLSGRPSTGAKGGASLYNQTGTGLYTV